MPLRKRATAVAVALVSLASLLVWVNKGEQHCHHRADHRFHQNFYSRDYEQQLDFHNGSYVDPSLWEPDDHYLWKKVKTHYHVPSIRPTPSGEPEMLPKVQAVFDDYPEVHVQRQRAIKDTFIRCWTSYKKHAWMADELKPISAGRHDPFGGWAATLVDSLDTLWIMNMKDEFYEAVEAAAKIDFAKSTLEEVNIFETTIRYLGGFLSAFDLSGNPILLKKAVEVGEMIYKSFDTPNRMPVLRWNFRAAAEGKKQMADGDAFLAEIGSLSLELARLSQLTGDHKWFDASQRIMEVLATQQDLSFLPGQWPVTVDPRSQLFSRGDTFTLGSMADSTYEYLPKMTALLGGQMSMYQVMYEKAVNSAVEYNLFRPMTLSGADILMSGTVRATIDNEEKVHYRLDTKTGHLACFLGGMLALGSRLFNRPNDLEIAAKLTDGCIYTYQAFPMNIMPETFTVSRCPSRESCKWSNDSWRRSVLEQARRPTNDLKQADAIILNERLPKGFTKISDRRYLLRPEAIESIFVMYRVTGHQKYAESAWDMFTAIERATATELANAAIVDVTSDTKELADGMESFWMSETLKYFYLVFSGPELVSLNEWVFNTEAHPLRRMTKKDPLHSK